MAPGPCFVRIRDRRWGNLAASPRTSPYREAMGRLVYDTPLSAVPEADSATFLDNARTPAPNRCRGGCRTG
ncbi:DUF5825 family protein [Streptomyces sioyaensis]|uniref:DUF5825 family protein n=1 Tax=Streptomyces sioyaensis TaxID=67364 RepID=UPI0037A27DF4